MQIGVIGGTGPAGSGLAVRLASLSFDVLIGSRSPERAEAVCSSLREKWHERQLALKGTDNREAADADLVVVATPWDAAAPTVQSVCEQLAGKVVISMANALVRMGQEFTALVPPLGSVAAHVQAGAPLARVVAAFQHLPARELANLDHLIDSDVLLCSDHPSAIEEASELVRRIPRLRPLDAGRLSSASPVEAFTAVLLQVNGRYKTRSAVRMTGIDVS